MMKIICCALLATIGMPTALAANDVPASGLVQLVANKNLVPPSPPRRGPWSKKECREKASLQNGVAVYRLCCTFTYEHPHQVVSSCGPWHSFEGKKK
jgi:hypothetical protein